MDTESAISIYCGSQATFALLDVLTHSQTWKHGDDSSYSRLVLHELEESTRSRPWDWISAIRLALHHFQARDILAMKEFLHIFETSRVSALGEQGGALSI